MTIGITIGGASRSDKVFVETLQIEDHINQRVNEASFTTRGGYKPSVGDEVSITDGSTTIFAGIVIRVETLFRGLKTEYAVRCKDWTHYLDRNLVSERYEDTTVGVILTDLIENYTTGFAPVGVDAPQSVGSIAFARIPVSECIERLANITNYSWYVDYQKQVHFFAKNAEEAPFNLTDEGGNHLWDSLRITEDISQLRNSIYVIGGEIEGNERTEQYVADGDQLQFPLANKFAAKPAVTVDGAAQTVGVDFLDPEDDFDCFWSFQQKYIRFKDATKPAASDEVAMTGIPLYPIIVNVPSNLSIGAYGEYEFKIKDTSIRTRAEAIDRAKAEIKAYANSIQEGRFATYRSGLASGQTITIDVGEIAGQFLIQSVTLRMRTPEDGEWVVGLATLKTIGIIDFLQSLMRDDEITQDEAETLLNLISADESVEVTDTLTMGTRVTSPPYVYGPSAGNEGKYNFSTYS